MKYTILVSVIFQVVFDVLTAVAFVIYIFNTTDTSVHYYYDFIRTFAIILICIGDIIVYPAVLSHLFYSKIIEHRSITFQTGINTSTATVFLVLLFWVSITSSIFFAIWTIQEKRLEWEWTFGSIGLIISQVPILCCLIWATWVTYSNPKNKTD